MPFYGEYSDVVDVLILLAGRPPFQPRLFLLEPEVVFAARVVLPDPAEYPVVYVAYNTVTVGDYTDIRDGMTILLGSTPGGDDYGRQRVRGTPTTISIYIGRSSRGISDGEVTLVDGAYITVLDDHRVWAKVPFYDSNNTDALQFKDSDLEVEWRTTNPPPVANAGQGDARTADEDTGVANLFMSGVNSFATADGATITDYLWDIADGTLLGGSLVTDVAIQVSFPPGFRYVSLTVTDSHGHQHTCYTPFFVDDPIERTSIDGFDISDASVTTDGIRVSIKITQDAPSAIFPEGTLAMIWMREPTSEANRDHMLVVGWLNTEDVDINADQYGLVKGTSIEILDGAARLDQLPGFIQAVADDETRKLDKLPDMTWNYMISPTMDKYIHYLLYWHSTALEVMDFIWSDTGTDYQIAIKSSDGGTLWQQVVQVAKDMLPGYLVTCTRANRILLLPDPMLQDLADRTSTVQNTLDEGDYSSIRYQRSRAPKVHWLRRGAVVVSPTIELDSDGVVVLDTVFSWAPGRTPGQGPGEQEDNEGLVASQEVLNATTGHAYARLNSPYGKVQLQLVADISGPGEFLPWSEIEPAKLEWVVLNLSAETAAQRGLTFTSVRCLPTELSMRFSHSPGGLLMDTSLTLEIETVGVPGETYIQPDVPASGVVTTPTPVSDVFVPDYGLVGNTNYVMGMDAYGECFRTSNFLSATPTWDHVTILPDGAHAPDLMRSMVVDPFSPGYRGVPGGAINAFGINDYGIFKLNDLFGSAPYATVIHVNTTITNDLRGMVLQASFGRYQSVESENPWLMAVVVRDDVTINDANDGTWETHSTDGGATWSAEQRLTATQDRQTYVDQQRLGLWLSPRTPGLARTFAEETITAMTGYESTDWGATWSNMTDPDLVNVDGGGGTIHVPWDDNLDEQIVYHGHFTHGTPAVWRTKKVVGTTITDISPMVSGTPHGPVYGHFSLRCHDNNRLHMAMWGAGNTGSGAVYTQWGLFTSTDGGTTWTQRHLDTDTDHYFTFGPQVAFAGDDENTLFIWGGRPGGLGLCMYYSTDMGATLQNKEGNLETLMNAVGAVGFELIAGGPTA